MSQPVGEPPVSTYVWATCLKLCHMSQIKLSESVFEPPVWFSAWATCLNLSLSYLSESVPEFSVWTVPKPSNLPVPELFFWTCDWANYLNLCLNLLSDLCQCLTQGKVRKSSNFGLGHAWCRTSTPAHLCDLRQSLSRPKCNLTFSNSASSAHLFTHSCSYLDLLHKNLLGSRLSATTKLCM